MGRLSAKTPIANLFLAGAWTFGGGMSAAMLSGRDTSRLVTGYLDGTEVVLMTAPNLEDSTIDSEPQVIVPQPVAPTPAPAKPIAASPAAAKPAPAVTLKAIGSERNIALRQIGRPAVLLFHTQETAEQAEQINQALRQTPAYADPKALFIANVVDLHAVPKLFRNFAEKAMRDSYKKAATSMPVGVKPEDFVLILPDWDGATTKAVGLNAVDKTAGVVVIDAAGGIIGKVQSNGAVTAVLDLLARQK